MSPSEVLERLTDRFRLLRGAGAGWNATRRCARRCSGPTTCSTTTNAWCCSAVRCSPAASTSPPSRSWSARRGTSTRCWICWIRWSASRSSPPSGSVTAPGTGCWRRSASSPRSSWPPPTGIDTIRDRHARYFADQAARPFRHVGRAGLSEGDRLGGCGVRQSARRVPVGDRPAATSVTATAIAATTALLAFALNRFEPVGWAEELLPAATAADVPQLPRLYTAAAQCCVRRASRSRTRVRRAGAGLGGRLPL